LRYVMWIAEFSESSNLWTHIAPSGIPEGMPVWVSLISQPRQVSQPVLLLGCWRLAGFLSQLLLNSLAEIIGKTGFSLIKYFICTAVASENTYIFQLPIVPCGTVLLKA